MHHRMSVFIGFVFGLDSAVKIIAGFQTNNENNPIINYIF
jgi:hypothetical protein